MACPVDTSSSSSYSISPQSFCKLETHGATRDTNKEGPETVGTRLQKRVSSLRLILTILQWPEINSDSHPQ